MSVGYVYDPIYLEHDTGNHPENGSRLVAIMDHLEQIGLLARMVAIPAEPATLGDLARIHSPAYIQHLQDLTKGGRRYIDLDTVISARSYEAARYAAGGTIAATRAVLCGDVGGAYALVRPPGHHAVRERTKGFCLFNNIAVAAAWALSQGQVSRIGIVDFDVHHGNGTEQAFASDARVLYISTHQYPYYPGTGHWREKGTGGGEGTCLNIPLPANTGDTGYAQAFDRLVTPALHRFRPDLILVSAGYDAHWADPLAWMLLSLSGYRQIVDKLVGCARELCDGRLVFVLEGGYDLDVLAHGVATTLCAMLDLSYEDVLGPARETEETVDGLLDRIARWHGLG